MVGSGSGESTVHSLGEWLTTATIEQLRGTIHVPPSLSRFMVELIHVTALAMPSGVSRLKFILFVQ